VAHSNAVGRTSLASTIEGDHGAVAIGVRKGRLSIVRSEGVRSLRKLVEGRREAEGCKSEG